MIKTTELRIGNWVYESERAQFPMFVDGLDVDNVYLDFPGNRGGSWDTIPTYLEGIPITEDILVNAGFNHLGWYLHHEGQMLRL